MKIIISHGGLSREVHTPFAICMDVCDMEELISALKGARAAMIATGGSYGWMRIDPSHPSDAAANTPPLKWHEPR